MRRPRRIPTVCGRSTFDCFQAYRSERWTLVGKREMVIPYNAYRVHGDRVGHDIVGARHLNPLRYEIHRVWVVEARLKPGQTHLQPACVYLDEDSERQITKSDSYDLTGTYQRTAKRTL
jgi:hypothetical protein